MSDEKVITLSERLAQGSIPQPEALKYALALADAIRRMHDRDTFAGDLEPARLVLHDSGIELIHGEACAISPYTAPELLQGKPPEARSDIFAFGAIVYELLAGRKAFEGASPDELRTAILEREPAPLPDGKPQHAVLGRLIGRCLVKDPDERWQRMQCVQVELKLFAAAVRRSEQSFAVKRDSLEKRIRTEIDTLDERIAARLAAQDGIGSELKAALVDQCTKLLALADSQQALLTEMAAVESQLTSRMEASEGAAAASTVRLGATEQALETQRRSIQSLKASVAQTGDVIEHLVEAVDSLEGLLADRYESQMAVFGSRP